MKPKKIFKMLMIVLFLFFTTLYFGQAAGYLEAGARRKTTLTDDAIRRFEEDLALGIEIDFRNYLPMERDYHNRFTRAGRNVSSLVEDGFNRVMNRLFRGIQRMVYD